LGSAGAAVGALVAGAAVAGDAGAEVAGVPPPQAVRIMLVRITKLITSIKRFLYMVFSSYREIEILVGLIFGKAQISESLFAQPSPSRRQVCNTPFPKRIVFIMVA